MSYEAGSTECRGLIEAKESLIKAMNSLGSIRNLDHIQKTLRDVYNELEEMHESRRIEESSDLNWVEIQFNLLKTIKLFRWINQEIVIGYLISTFN